MKQKLLRDLVEKLKAEIPNLDLVLTERPVGQRYAGLDAIPYPSYSLDMWIEDFKTFCDTTKPVFIWDVELKETNVPMFIVNASLTIKGDVE